MPEPYNYAGILGQAQQLVPNLLNREIERSIGMAQVQQIQQQAAQAQQKQQRFGLYQQAIKQYLANPTARGASLLITQFPEYGEQVTAGWKALDASRQTVDKRQMGEAYAAIMNGSPDVALKVLQPRYDADEAAGEASEVDKLVIDALRSGDPEQIKRAGGLIGANLAAIDPQGFKAAFGDKTALERNVAYLNSIGRPELVESYLQGETNKPQIVQVKDPATGKIDYYDARQLMGGPNTAPTPQPSDGGFVAASGAKNLISSMGADGFLKWQGKYGKPVLVNSAAEAAGLPKGTLIQAPDGRQKVIE